MGVVASIQGNEGEFEVLPLGEPINHSTLKKIVTDTHAVYAALFEKG